MTALEIYNKSSAILGYSDSNNNTNLTGRVINRAVPLFNIVYSDMRRICGMVPKNIESLSDEVEIPEKAIEVMVCGLASYIANSEGDDNMQAFWSAEYQARRTTLSRVEEIEDVLPNVE